MQVDYKGLTLIMRAIREEDILELVKYFSSMSLHLYTKGLFAQTPKNEFEWDEKNRKDPESCTWAIEPKDLGRAIGITSLHRINAYDNSCSSGIIIWDPEWWGQGVAGVAHIGRTYWAAYEHNRWTINSTVRTENVASRRALERVGYTVWGTEPLTTIRRNKRLAAHHLKWIHPEMADMLFAGQVPEMYQPGLERARVTLALASSVVTFP